MTRGLERVCSATEYERGEGVKFDRIRRITGYLVGTLDRFNNGKAAEEKDRVKHDANTQSERVMQMEKREFEFER